MGVVVRQSIKGTLMTYVGVCIGFVTTFFIVTEFLSVEEVGLAKVLVDSSILLSGLAQLGTNTSAMRYYPFFKDAQRHDNGFFGWTLIVPLIGFIIFGSLFLLFQQPLSVHFSKESPLFVNYMYFVLPMSFFMLYLTVFETNSNLLLRIVVPKFIREVGIRLMTMAAYLLYAFAVVDLDGMVLCLCGTYLVATLCNVAYLLFLKRVSFRINLSFIKPQLRRDFLLYTLFLVVSSLTTIIAPMLNTFFISIKMGLAFTGIYTIAQYIANMMEIPYRSLGAISRPHISQALKDNDLSGAERLSKSVSLHQFLASTFIFFLIWINIDAFYDVLPNGSTYENGKWVFFILALCKILNSSLTIDTTILSYSKYYYWSLLFTAILTVSAIWLNIRLIPQWGMVGAALASLVAYVVYFALVVSFVKWKIGVRVLSLSMLKVLIITAVLFICNDFIVVFFDGRIAGMFGNNIVGIIFDSAVRTVSVGIVGIAVVYFWKVSPYVNNMVDKLIFKTNREK